jgi:hypothetical protein
MVERAQAGKVPAGFGERLNFFPFVFFFPPQILQRGKAATKTLTTKYTKHTKERIARDRQRQRLAPLRQQRTK